MTTAPVDLPVELAVVVDEVRERLADRPAR